MTSKVLVNKRVGKNKYKLENEDYQKLVKEFEDRELKFNERKLELLKVFDYWSKNASESALFNNLLRKRKQHSALIYEVDYLGHLPIEKDNSWSRLYLEDRGLIRYLSGYENNGDLLNTFYINYEGGIKRVSIRFLEGFHKSIASREIENKFLRELN